MLVRSNSLEKTTGWIYLLKCLWILFDEKKYKFLFWEIVLYITNYYVVVPPLILGVIIDFFTHYTPETPLTLFYVYTVILGISFAVVSFLRLCIKNILGDLGSDVAYSVKVRGFEKLLNFSLEWHDQEITGNKTQRIQTGVQKFRELLHISHNEVSRFITAFSGTIFVFLFLQPIFILLFVFYLGVFLLMLSLFFKKIYATNEEYFQSIEKAGGSYIEGLGNILTLKTLGAGDGFRDHIAKKEEKTKQYEYSIRKLYNNLWKIFHTKVLCIM